MHSLTHAKRTLVILIMLLFMLLPMKARALWLDPLWNQMVYYGNKYDMPAKVELGQFNMWLDKASGGDIQELYSFGADPVEWFNQWAEVGYQLSNGMVIQPVETFNYVFDTSYNVSWWSNLLSEWSKLGFGSMLSNSIKGGICPTFIQSSLPKNNDNYLINSTDSLKGKIVIPSTHDLIRSDVTIYGVAGGRNFMNYIVEYGKGTDPDRWYLIDQSDKPQNKFSPSELPDLLKGDLDLRGNLATWNTGLKNWEHLPWHPASDTTDFNGIYTIRLTVIGKNNQKVEDRVVCEVGRVIAQCIPGIACNEDQSVILRFPEQALTKPFRLYSIIPQNSTDFPVPSSIQLVSDIYRIREDGDIFIKPVSLEMHLTDKMTSKLAPATDLSQISIYSYDSLAKMWNAIPTRYISELKTYQAELTKLPYPKALFALIYDRSAQLSLKRDIDDQLSIKELENTVTDKKVLCLDDFSKDLSEWSARDGGSGASISVIPDGHAKNNPCIKVFPTNVHSDFACNIRTSPYSLAHYQMLSFNYKMESPVKLAMMFSVANRWYALGINGYNIDSKYKDVNITYIGQISDIKSDGSWHHAEINLWNILNQYTRNYEIDHVILANWKVNGFMNLDFGNNAVGSSIMFDDFSIYRNAAMSSKRETSYSISEQIFKDQSSFKSVFNKGEGSYCNVFLDSIKNKSQKTKTIHIAYNVSKAGSYAGWYYALKGMDLSGMNTLQMNVQGMNGLPSCLVGFKSINGVERKIRLCDFCDLQDTNTWQLVTIPFWYFNSIDFTALDNISFSFENSICNPLGSLFINSIVFSHKDYDELPVIDFKRSVSTNLCGFTSDVFKNARAKIVKEEKPNEIKLLYSGDIGSDMGYQGFSYCGWETYLGGCDFRDYAYLKVQIKGITGKEYTHVYLDDGTKRRSYEISQNMLSDNEFKTILVPLSYFKEDGIDISHIERIQFVFEWKPTGGELSINEVNLVSKLQQSSTVKIQQNSKR